MVSKTESPLFSVIVLSYLQRHYLEACLESVFQQTYSNIELVICDDCSADFYTDEVLSYIDEHKGGNIQNVVVFRQTKNVGITQNAQTGVGLSSGVFFKLLAADDMLYEETALEKMSALFQSTDTGMIAARSRACQQDGTMTDHLYPALESWNCTVNADAQTQFNLLATQGLQVYFHEPALFWRRSLFDEIGGFDTEFRYVTDWPVLLKVTGSGHRILVTEDITTIYRYGGMMNRDPASNPDFRKQYYLECISILQKYGLKRFEAEGFRKKVVRCRQAIWCLESRIVEEQNWGSWNLGQQLMWRIKNTRFFFISWLYRLRCRGYSMAYARPALLIMAACMAAYAFDIQLQPGKSSAFLWSILFFAAVLWLLIQAVGVFFVRLLNLLLNFRGKRP